MEILKPKPEEYNCLIRAFIFLFTVCFFPLANGESPHALHKTHSPPPRIEQNQTDKKGKQKIYHLTVDYKTVNFTGKKKQAMAINDSLPAPTLYFTEGETAVIHVTNKMNVETSIHWHGILLPNFQDGVPYLTTPPIKPGKTHTFTFPLKHSGTYWYHSHTGLQEQRGIYGAIVIEPKKREWNYDQNLTLVLSDWTDENPKAVLRTLKRGSEWYSVKKQTTQSLYRVIKHKALGAQFKLWRQRMPGMDISDVYYPAFLINGKTEQTYPHFKEGQKIRLRVINAGASTYFWLSFGGKVLLISADGINVQPVPTDKVLHAIGETYDFLFTLPQGKAMEFRATAQDGSGSATVLIGTGDPLKAPVPPKPDLMKQMKDMAESHGSHGHGKTHSHLDHAAQGNRKSNKSMGHKHPSHPERMPKSEGSVAHQNSIPHKNHQTKESEPHESPAHAHHKKDHKSKGMTSHQNHAYHKDHNNIKPTHSHPMNQKEKHESKAHHASAENQLSASSYDDLKAINKTQFSKTLPVKKIHLNLTGNMRRYVWSMNGKVLSESDKIKITKNEVVRITLQNETMMHHPMHLHGHFFRVLNKQGDYSPLKHTVDVPPMETVTIEFAPDEKGDWFFHCHVPYHMKGGMARIFSRGDTRDPRLKDYPLSPIWNADRQWYFWGDLALMTNRLDWQLEISNTRNRIHISKTISWFDSLYQPHKNYEMEATYEHFFTDLFRIYGGMKAENPEEGHWDRIKNTDWAGKIGMRYLLPYLIELDFSLDHKMRVELELEYELLLLSRLELLADWSWTEYLAQEDRKNKKREQEWSLGLNYIMTQSLSFIGSYNNHFGWGVGINWKF